MTTQEAFAETTGLVDELETSGIRVERTRISNPRPEAVAQYDGPERIAPSEWMSVSLYPQTDEEKERVSEAARKLNWMGVAFDTGRGFGAVDWSLDWSWRYTGKPNQDHEERLNMVDDTEIEGD